MKRGNKSGQFYLLTTIIIVGLIFGFATIINYSQEKSNFNFNYAKEELNVESENVMNYALVNSKDIKQMLINFTKTYSNYSEANNLYFIFGNRTGITIAGYQKLNNGNIFADAGNGNQQLTLVKGVYNYMDIINPQKDITLTINGIAYSFSLSAGENFYFILSKEIKGDLYIVSNDYYNGGVYFGSSCITNSLTINSDTNNYNIYNALGSPASSVSVSLTINSGVVVGSTSILQPALTTGNLPAGSSVTIINNGYIVGKGGDGGKGRTLASGLPGENGGPALEATVPTIIENNSIILGGGGGGGAGGGANCHECYDDPGAGGGGGAGRDIGLGGTSGLNGSYIGSDGTLTTGGAGGTVSYQGSNEYNQAGNGGNGGNLGSNGQNGQNGMGYSGGLGGTVGTAIIGSNFVKYTNNASGTQICTANFNATYSNIQKNAGSNPNPSQCKPSQGCRWWYYNDILQELDGFAGITVNSRQKCYNFPTLTDYCDPIKTDIIQLYGTNHIIAGGQIISNNDYIYTTDPSMTVTETYWGVDDNSNNVNASYTITVS